MLQVETRPRVLTGGDLASDVVRRVTTRLLEGADLHAAAVVEDALKETVYAERHRISHTGNGTRASEDFTFVTWLHRELASAGEERLRELLARVVGRYVDEISGHFAPWVYTATTRVLPVAIAAFLHGIARNGSPSSDPRAWFDIDDRLLIEGRVETLRRLARMGTVILVPTHVSNLDSVILGLAIHRMGLPPFAYGAGLNLFTNAVLGFFMRNLGAYTIDRKKTDPLYRAVLKEYCTVLLERGQHSLFFPGGTRSRSGAIETRLKLGLLGTAPVAYQHGLAEGPRPPRIFVVPCTLSYPVVLESASLIEDHLRAEGGPHYLEAPDESEHPRHWLDFLSGLSKLDLRVHLVVGDPMDCIGNPVDADGRSCDPRGRAVALEHYFGAPGHPVQDVARDAEYTRTLAARVLDAFRRDTVLLPTNVLARALFDEIQRRSSQPDLFRLLRTLGPETRIACAEVERAIGALQDELAKREGVGRVRRSRELRAASPTQVIERALAAFAGYHATPPAKLHDGHLYATDPKLLFYYANRLEIAA